MQRYRIVHRTYYNFSAPVTLGPHSMLLRPRENHELRIESLSLDISPQPELRWHRDVEDNSVAIATFGAPAQQLAIKSDVIICQYLENPLDFLVADYAISYPFAYQPDDLVMLAPYMTRAGQVADDKLSSWIDSLWKQGEAIQTYSLLRRLNEARFHEVFDGKGPLEESRLRDIIKRVRKQDKGTPAQLNFIEIEKFNRDYAVIDIDGKLEFLESCENAVDDRLGLFLANLTTFFEGHFDAVFLYFVKTCDTCHDLACLFWARGHSLVKLAPRMDPTGHFNDSFPQEQLIIAAIGISMHIAKVIAKETQRALLTAIR